MRLSFIFFCLLVTLGAKAQLQLPELSPRTCFRAEIGHTHFRIDYGRPSIRGRKIMGEVVPFNRLWRTGGGPCTIIRFDEEVTINKTRIKPGAYAMVTIPGEKTWTVLFNADTTKLYGDPSEYDPKTEAARIEVAPEQTAHLFESLTIWLDHVRYDAELLLAWEHTLIHFTIQTHDHDEAKAAIAQALEKNPASMDLLSQAAYYYTALGENDEQVLTWLNKALAIHEDRWVYIQKLELLEKRKDYRQARSTAEKALAYLRKEKPDNDGWEYGVRQIEAKIKTWPQAN